MVAVSGFLKQARKTVNTFRRESKLRERPRFNFARSQDFLSAQTSLLQKAAHSLIAGENCRAVVRSGVEVEQCAVNGSRHFAPELLCSSPSEGRIDIPASPPKPPRISPEGPEDDGYAKQRNRRERESNPCRKPTEGTRTRRGPVVVRRVRWTYRPGTPRAA